MVNEDIFQNGISVITDEWKEDHCSFKQRVPPDVGAGTPDAVHATHCGTDGEC